MDTKKRDLLLSFDVGHSSLGWAVLNIKEPLSLLGCGVVAFRADDCLASSRRDYRRQRRHIRSTRQRIARLKTLLAHLQVLSREALDRPGCAWPWQLAAAALHGHKTLSWPELWDVLRWYAHNRGYDGNRRWSATDANDEDTEKEKAALALLRKHGTDSMAETFCAELRIDPHGGKKSSTVRFKGLNAAFPRTIVETEVRRILRNHFGKLPQVDEQLERCLLGRDAFDKDAWQAIACPELKLPKRYQGSLLFGQLVPRFDNRIISRCPFTGEKVPSRDCREFFNYRWGMLLANVKVCRASEAALSPLSAAERKELDTRMRQQGSMGTKEFRDAVRQVANAARDNLDTMFMHPDSKEALVLDPVQQQIQSPDLNPFWLLLPERLQKRTHGRLRRGRNTSLGQLRQQLVELGFDATAFDAELARQLDSANIRKRKKEGQITREDILQKVFAAKKLSQRAPYSRKLLEEAFQEVVAGKDPRETGGCLDLQKAQNTAKQTNNHLIRHRLLILSRLLKDILKEFVDGDKSRVAKIAIEVNRDLREVSGMTAKQIAQHIGKRVANHHHVAEALEEKLADNLMNGKPIPINAGLIRKARIADDLGWKCPYTGATFEAMDLVTRRVDKDHIVPRSQRFSDSLDSLVITYSEVNKWKGNRTAWRFVEQEQGKPVPGMPGLSIQSISRYRQFAEGLETFKGHDDDKRRKKRRKALLLLPTYEEKEFTPRDLTVTSQLVRLAAQVLQREFQGIEPLPSIVHLPGSVTGVLRKTWKLMGCLSLAAPRVMNSDGTVKTKDEIRDITHLHHALDACVLGLAAHFIPKNGRVWELLVKGRLNDSERRELAQAVGGHIEFGQDNRFQLRDLDDSIKEQIRQKLAEKRVVQHIPARMDGLRVEQNMWRVVSVADGKAVLRQRIRQADASRPKKENRENVSKLLGLEPNIPNGKLKTNKGVLIIPENFGVALSQPEPVVIPFHKVWHRISALKEANDGKIPPVLRNGQIIRVIGGKNYVGIWKIFSVKNDARGIAIDIGSPDALRVEDKTEGHKRNVRLATLIKDGMETPKVKLTGIPACPTTSSASTHPSVP